MQKLDEGLYALLLTLPRFPFLSLVRADRRGLKEARRTLRETGVGPSFSYSRAMRFDAALYIEKLTEVEARLVGRSEAAPLLNLYQKKCDELRARAEMILAIQRGDDLEVTRLAKVIFGTPKFDIDELLAERVSKKTKRGFVHKLRVDAQMLATMTRTMLDHYGLTNWRVKVAKRLTVQIGHGKRGLSPMVRIPRKLLISKQRAVRLLTHEIEVHALRTANGAASKLHLLERGCAGYIQTDEGLAMYYQEIMLADETPKTIQAGWWEAYTVALTEQYDFAGVYNKLCKLTSADKAWRLCLRAYRGITKPTTAGLGFYRDHVYRTGFMAVQAAHRTGGMKFLEKVFAGNVQSDDLPALDELGIKGGRQPEMVAKRIVNEELRRQKRVL